MILDDFHSLKRRGMFMKKLLGLLSLITISSVMASDGEEGEHAFRISPIAAAEKKEKENALPMEPMEQISDIDQLDKYKNKVVAYTLSDPSDSEYLFTLQDQNNLIPIGYGILSIDESLPLPYAAPLPSASSEKVYIQPFQKVHFGSEGAHYVSKKLTKHRENIKIRLANNKEKRRLWIAILNAQFECYNVEKSDVSKCLKAKA
jgi:hypothetical protein